MGLDSAYGVGSLRTGVCTTATRPASPFTGQTIYDTTVATTLVWNGTAWAGTSKIAQVVQATYATYVTTTSTSYVTTGLTLAITPTLNTSKVLILATGCIGVTSSAGGGYFTIFRGTVAGTNLFGATGGVSIYNSAGQISGSLAASFLDSPATTSATTYTIGMKADSGATVQAQPASTTNTITLIEVLV